MHHRFEFPEDVDFKKIKNGHTVTVGYKTYDAKQSKGRTMLQFDKLVRKEENVPYNDKGYVMNDIHKYHFETVMILGYDTGHKEVRLTSRRHGTRESYDLPNGQKTSNRWDIYQWYLLYN